MATRREKSRQLLLGIDLGTSQTAVISSRGEKALVRSVVGYPKDVIATRLLNNIRVVGDEALEKRSYLNLYYPLEDGVLKEANERNSAAAKELLEHAISLVNPQPGDEILGIIGVPARASVNNKGQLLKITHQLMDLSMVVSEPFMAAYGMGRLTNAIIIDIGAGTIDFCALKGTVPTDDDQITLLKAGNYVDQLLTDAIAESYPDVQITPLLAKKIKERYGYVGESKGEVMVNLRSGGRPVSCDLSQEVRLACESILPDLFESLEQLIAHFDPEYQEEVLNNIILAGGGGQMMGLRRALIDHLQGYGEVNVIPVDNPTFAGAVGALKLATELPPEYWTQVGDVVGS
ncbi:MAG: rod shape-determining protein [Magnetococcales bacterium]|nr:rod shape-determining protein [Magnetococcales bacterium]